MQLLNNANMPLLFAGLNMMSNPKNPFQGATQGLLMGMNYDRQKEQDAWTKKKYQNQQNYQDSQLAMQKKRMAMAQAKHDAEMQARQNFSAAFTPGQNGQSAMQTQFPGATPQELAVAQSMGNMGDANTFLLGRADARKKTPEYRTAKDPNNVLRYVDGPKSGQPVFANVPAAPKPAFEGNSLNAQALSIVHDYDQKQKSGAPISDAEEQRYRLAKMHLQKPTTVTTPQGTYVQPGYDLSGFSPKQEAPAQTDGQSPVGFTPKENHLPQHMTAAAGYAKRMTAAEEALNRITSGGYDPTSISENVLGLTNVTASKEHQQFEQAKKDWARAKLRDESGAVISEEEIENEIKTYFPVFGDSPEVVAQKEAARKRATQGMIESAGKAYIPPTKPLPPNITRANIEHTAQKHGVSIEEAKKKIAEMYQVDISSINQLWGQQ